jgi:hypothetical protein
VGTHVPFAVLGFDGSSRHLSESAARHVALTRLSVTTRCPIRLRASVRGHTVPAGPAEELPSLHWRSLMADSTTDLAHLAAVPPRIGFPAITAGAA